MSSSITLVLLKCRKCGADLSGEKEGKFFYCAGCGAGFIPDENDEFSEIPVYFALYNCEQSNDFLPFWAFDAQLKLQNVDTSSFFQSKERGFIRLFNERGAIRMYVPAFADDLKRNKPYSLSITHDQPELKYVDRRDKVENVVFSSEDARAIADHLFLTSEIMQSDTMKSLSYELTLQNPFLIVIGV